LITRIKNIDFTKQADKELADKITTNLDKVELADIRSEIKADDLIALNELLKSQTFVDEFVEKLV
jgi:hypothetical protein